MPDIVPRAALTIPHVFLHLAPSIIPGAGIGVFSTLTDPRGVRFGPYCAQRATSAESAYCWQIYSRDNRRSHVLDAADAQRSNWMRYVNCARHSLEQNLVACQYRGRIYYRTIKIIPRFTELLVFYGSEFANALGVKLDKYNCVQYYKDVIHTANQAIEHHSSNNNASDTTNIKHNNDIDLENTDELVMDINDFQVINEEQSIPTNNDESQYNTRDLDENNSTQSKIEDNIYTERESFTEHNTITIHFNELADQHLDMRHDKDNVETNSTQIKCNKCDKTFAKKKYLTAHYKRNTATCSNFDKSKDFGNNKVDDEKNNSHKNRLECDKCGKTFAKKKYLTAHYKIHTNTLYRCTQCQYTTAYKYRYNKHCSTHNKHSTYSCDICSYKTDIKQHLLPHRLQHNTTTASVSKSYYTNVKKCEICLFETYSKKSYLTHMLKHKGLVYKCPHCDYSVYSQTYLRQHVLRRHESTE